MEIAGICEAMHWTYEQYMAQPIWFIETLKLKFKIDSDNLKKKKWQKN